MTGRQMAKVCASLSCRFREWVSSFIPTLVFAYPFEIVASCIAFLIGLPALVGLSTSASLVALVGLGGFYGWAVLLSIGFLVTFIGLKRESYDGLASGLTLLGGGFLVYSLALVVIAGWGGAAAGGAFIALGGMSLIRALHFRRLIDIQRGATRLTSEGGRR